MIPREAAIHFTGVLFGGGAMALFMAYGNPGRNSIIAIAGYLLIVYLDWWQSKIDKERLKKLDNSQGEKK